MPRRVSLPGAAELFRTTPVEEAAERRHTEPIEEVEAPGTDPAETDQVVDETPEKPAPKPRRRGGGSGRVRHEEKITVYVSSDELLDLERARLSLRAEHRMAVDRGRIVRAALAMALGDLKDHGQDSELVRRLSEQ